MRGVGPASHTVRDRQSQRDKHLDVSRTQCERLCSRTQDSFIIVHLLIGKRFVYEHQALAYQEMNNYEGVLRAGAQALTLGPRNIKVLVALALAIPNGVTGRPDSSHLLAQAERSG